MSKMTENNLMFPTTSPSFNKLLADNPLPFSICMKNAGEKVNPSTKPSSSPTRQSNISVVGLLSSCSSSSTITSSVDESIQMFLGAFEKAGLEVEKIFDTVRNEKNNTHENFEKFKKISLKTINDLSTQLDEAIEKSNSVVVDDNKNLTLEEKNYMTEYKSRLRTFLAQLFDWMTKMFLLILEKMGKDQSGDVEAASLLFQTVIHILQNSDIHGLISANCKVKCPHPDQGMIDLFFRSFH